MSKKEELDDPWHSAIEIALKNLRRDLSNYFEDKVMTNSNIWAAKEHGELSAISASKLTPEYQFVFHYPEPNNLACHKITLDFISPALMAYAAGMEYKRTSDERLFNACLNKFTEWDARKKTVDLANKLKGSKNGRKPRTDARRKIETAMADRMMAAGKNNSEIGRTLGVSREAIRKYRNEKVAT
ncbi:MAG: hypothetical protein PSX71_01770 [bacterium]|nr:hypothetical protein [bacterium]